MVEAECTDYGCNSPTPACGDLGPGPGFVGEAQPTPHTPVQNLNSLLPGQLRSPALARPLRSSAAKVPASLVDVAVLTADCYVHADGQPSWLLLCAMR